MELGLVTYKHTSYFVKLGHTEPTVQYLGLLVSGFSPWRPELNRRPVRREWLWTVALGQVFYSTRPSGFPL